LNSVSQPIATQFGYHLIQITKRSADSATGRHILVPIEVTGDHRDQLDARADSLENLAAERLDPAALDTAARALGLSIRTSGAVVKNRFSNLPPDAQVWAFQARPGEHSPVIETPTDYVVARLDSVRDAGIPRLEAMRGEVEALVRAQKKQAKARELAQQIRERAGAQGGTLEAAAKAANLPYNTVGPVTRINAPLNGGQAIGRAFGLEPAEIAGPVDGRGVVYVMQGIERSAADSAEFVKELPELRQRALDNMRQIHLRQYLAALRTNAEIVDERDQIYKTAAQVEAEAPVVPGSRPQ
jgi:hypothetical protein